MYRVEGKVRNVTDVEGNRRTEQAPPVELHTAAGLLRWALNNRIFEHRIGGRRYPVLADEKWLGQDGNRGYNYHLIDTFAKYVITAEHLTAMRRAQARYREIIHHLREVDPGWVPDPATGDAKGEIHYADNSIEVHEISTTYPGLKRHRMALAPSGDACF